MYVICFSLNKTFTLLFADKPRCAHTSPLNVAVSESLTNLIPCDSAGFPQATTFRWVLNTSGIEETLKQKTSALKLTKKQLRFSDDEKYVGLLECWAANNVGEADKPCTFQLVAAGERYWSLRHWVIRG